MKKLLALPFAVLMVVAFAAPASSHEGFVLIGADAAYAEITNLDGCTASIGYVDAKGVKYLHGPLESPHADVQVKLSGTCLPPGDGSSGTLNISGGDPGANLVKLTSANLGSWGGGTAFIIDDGDFYAEMVLDWTAIGDTYTMKVHEPGKRATHRMRDATLADGFLEVGENLFTTQDTYSAWITHYTEIQNDNMP